MLLCFNCGVVPVAPGFAHLCRGCYRQYMNRNQITNEEFATYINKSFRIKMIHPRTWNFRRIHKRLKLQYPTIKPLACILESIVFIKMLLTTTTTQLVKCRF